MDPLPEISPSNPSEQIETPVLATTSILFYVRGEPYVDNEQAIKTQDEMSEKLRLAVQTAFAGDSGVEVIGAVAVRYPGQEGSNIYRCAKCGKWLTDHHQPDPCDGLMFGYLVNGEYLCDQHQEMAILSGEIPRPEGFWISADDGE